MNNGQSGGAPEALPFQPGVWFPAKDALVMSAQEHFQTLPANLQEQALAQGVNIPDIRVVYLNPAPLGKSFAVSKRMMELMDALAFIPTGGEEAVQAFVRRHGPLVGDFLTWVVTPAPVGARQRALLSIAPYYAGRAGGTFLTALYPEEPALVRYLAYVKRLRTLDGSLETHEPWLAPEPVALYRWVAREVLALAQPTHGSSTRAFLLDRLASLELVPPFETEGAEYRRITGLFVVGGLLDYLSLAAALNVGRQHVADPEVRTCESCGAVLYAYDGRVKYCESCQGRSASDAVRARRYRQRRRRGGDQTKP